MLGVTAAEVAALITEAGESARLRRVTGVEPQAFFEVELAASIRDFTPDELTGDVQQGDRMASISNGEIVTMQWPGPPRHNDQFFDATGKLWNVEHVDSLRIGAVYARHNLRIRG